MRSSFLNLVCTTLLAAALAGRFVRGYRTLIRKFRVPSHSAKQNRLPSGGHAQETAGDSAVPGHLLVSSSAD